ncbi:MAG: hypothetical protein IJC41_00210 [Firmicutes bacterium]|nr:hypothetical protein [Bacillota bacterium]
MALLNQSCILHYGEKGDISRFVLKDNAVFHTYWIRGEGVKKNDILAKGIDDIKACSDGERLYLFCADMLGDIEIYSYKNEIMQRSVIKTGSEDLIMRDIRPYISGNRCELLVSHSKRDDRNERILSKYSINAGMLSEGCRYPDHRSRDLMEYETFGPVDEIVAVRYEEECSTIVSVIEKSEDSNSIILLKDNRFGFVEGLIKISMNSDIFWHDISVAGNEAEVVYTVRDGEGFSIKNIVYDIKKHSLSEETLIREKNACSHPLLISYMGEKRICWYENGAVYSRRKNAEGEYENAVKHKESIGRELFCAHFILDDKQLKKQAGADFRKVFLIYPDNTMTGF